MRTKLSIFILSAAMSAAGVAGPQKLPPPQREGGPGVFSLLNRRQSSRRYTEKELSKQELSTLLWSGFGVTRADGRRTAPSAVNRQESTLYAILADGAYKYLPHSGELEKTSDEDLRKLVSGNVEAPAYILIVADLKRAASNEYAAMDAGYISQNLYLAATALDLGSCALGGFRRNNADIAALKAKLGLAAHEKPMLSQAVGRTK